MDNGLIFFVTSWFRLTDFVISCDLVALILITSLLFKQLIELSENIFNEDLNDGDSKFSLALDEWKGHYALVCELLENIKSVFGWIILIQIGHIVIEMTVMASIIMTRVKLGCYLFFEFDDTSEETSIFTNVMIGFSHVVLRLLAISSSCWYLKIQVKCYSIRRLYTFYHHRMFQVNGLTTLCQYPSHPDSQLHLEVKF